MDPFTHRDKLTVPILNVNGTNDLFWVLDAMSVFEDDLPGPLFRYYAANTKHNLKHGKEETIATVTSFFKYLDGRGPFPEVKANFELNGQEVSVEFQGEDDPWEVVLMTAESDQRDFQGSQVEGGPWKKMVMSTVVYGR